MSEVVLKSITKKYGANTVVNSIDLTAENGKLISILGPSGCGKTTTLRMIAGFEKPDGGEIYFDGREVKDIPVNKRNIGMVFQSYALFPHMTVEQNVAYGLEQRKLPSSEINERVFEALKLVHMEDYAKRKPKQLSGGQQQRVALARALVIKPDVLLLDECLSALDKKLRVEMQIELRKILEQTGVTTFFVTHDQEEAMTLSDKIVVMNEGRIEQAGTPFEIYEKPSSRFAAGFLGKANFFEGKILSYDGNKAEIQTENGKFSIPVQNAVAGEEMLFVVRPEKIHFVSDNSGIEGTIEHVAYSGNISSCSVNCNGKIIVCEVQNSDLSGRPQKGDKVSLWWSGSSSINISGGGK